MRETAADHAEGLHREEGEDQHEASTQKAATPLMKETVQIKKDQLAEAT